MALGEALGVIELGRRIVGTGSDIYGMEKQLRGDTPSWWQRAGAFALGPLIGGELYKGLVGRKLEAQQAAGRTAAGNELTSAAEAEMGAARGQMEQSLALALQRADRQYGAAGTYQSGARQAQRGQLTEAAMRDLSRAFASIELQRAGIAQQGELAREQMQMQRDIQTSQTQAGMAEAAVPIAMQYLIPWLTGGGEQGEGGGAPYEGMSFLEAAGPGWHELPPGRAPELRPWDTEYRPSRKGGWPY